MLEIDTQQETENELVRSHLIGIGRDNEDIKGEGIKVKNHYQSHKRQASRPNDKRNELKNSDDTLKQFHPGVQRYMIRPFSTYPNETN